MLHWNLVQDHSAYHQCPWCCKCVHVRGGGIANHIWRSPFCCKKRALSLKGNTSKSASPQPEPVASALPDPSPFEEFPSNSSLMELDPDNPFSSVIRQDSLGLHNNDILHMGNVGTYGVIELSQIKSICLMALLIKGWM